MLIKGERAVELKINENIRMLRKSRSLTQEQLAEAMGVSVGAVSKWEKGLSNPDIALLPHLADFFSVSVDVLLGYEWKNLRMGQAAEFIKKCTAERRFSEGAAAAEKAAIQYPNCFEVIYRAGLLYARKAVVYTDSADAERAIKLLERARELADGGDVLPADIMIEISEMEMLRGNYESAIELLKKNNINGVNDCRIGQCIAMQGKYEDSLVQLSKGFLGSSLTLFNSVMFEAISLANLERYQQAKEAAEWLEGFSLSLAAGKGSAGYRMAAEAALVAALFEVSAKNDAAAGKKLIQVKEYVRLYKEAPSLDSSLIRFCCCDSQSIFDSFGGEDFSVENCIDSCSTDGGEKERLLQIWRGINE